MYLLGNNLFEQCLRLPSMTVKATPFKEGIKFSMISNQLKELSPFREELWLDHRGQFLTGITG
jgi:hypothetical protein